MIPEKPFDPPLRALRLRDRTVGYTDSGDPSGPTFLLVHGLPGSVRDFRWLGSALRKTCPGARVVRIDMPGFGDTDETLGGPMTVEARAHFVADVAKALQLRDPVLVAHSMGGPIGIGAAALAAEPVRALVLLASVGLTPNRGYRSTPSPRLLAPVITSWLGRRLLMGRLRRGFVKAGFPESTPTSALLVTVRALGALRFETIRELADDVASRGTPVHVFAARDDRLVEPAIGEGLAERFGSPLHMYDDGGHNIQKTRAIEIATALAEL